MIHVADGITVARIDVNLEVFCHREKKGELDDES